MTAPAETAPAATDDAPPVTEQPDAGRGAPLDPARTRAWMWRVRHFAVILVLFAFALNTDAGRVINDTKLDLTVRPLALLERAVHLWDPLGSAGQLQNQAYGYLFPMGPIFAAGEAVGMPAWVVQRLWWGLLLGVSYLGFVVLARRLRIGTDTTRLVAGLGFALAPHVITVIGRSSVEAWPPALAPWVLVPLVGVAAAERPRRAAALSGLAVLAMGGVNAVVDLAALLPAVLWLLTRRWSLAWVRLCAWWALAVVAASLWWVVPLLTLGRFSPPFLDFIESAAYTTRTTSLVETLRGTADWVAYLGEAGSRAGYALLTVPLLVVMTVVLVVLGLVGIGWRRTPERVWLVLMVVAGAALVTMGHVGPVDGPASEQVRAALDGALAPLRNVHKFDILVRLALSLGVASALSLLSHGRTVAETRFLRKVVAVGGAFVVVGASTPFLGLTASPTGAYAGVPGYWSEAAAWLDENAGDGRTLLLPGSRFAQYTWGTTGDEPIQALGDTPWDIRNAVPLSSAGHIRWLDGVERQVATGRGGPDLQRALAGGGVRYLLVRNDLAYGAAGATRTATVRATLSTTPGVSLVASFGPVTGGGSNPLMFSDAGLNLALPAIEIYAVSGSGEPRATVVPGGGVSRVVGGAEAASLEGMESADPFVLTRDEPASTAQDALGAGPMVLTDTPRRREANFGVGTFGTSQTLSESDPLRIAKPTREYGDVGADDNDAVAVIGGARSVDASSSASDADSFPQSDPGSMPYAAFDGSPSTMWRPNPLKPVVGSWVSVDFGRSVSLGGGQVVLDPATAVTRLGITTDRGDTTVPVVDGVAELPEVRATHLTIGIDAVRGDEAAVARAGVRDVSVPGVTVTRTVRLPDLPDGVAPDRVVMSGDVGHGGCWLLGPRPLCAAGTTRVGEDAAGLDRTFTLPNPAEAEVALSARPQPGPTLQRRVEKALGLRVHATSSSVAVPDLAGGPMSAVDGNLGTAWVATPDDPDPALTLTWKARRSVDEVQVVLDGYVAATRPTHLRITSPDGNRDADLDASGTATFRSLDTDEMTLHFTAPGLATSLDAYTFRQTQVGLGVSDVHIAGLTPDLAVPTEPSTRPVVFPCGKGPVVQVAGTTVDTAVRTTVGDLLAGASLKASVCSPGEDEPDTESVQLPAGAVNVVAPSDDGWLTSSVVLTTDADAFSSAPVAGPSLEVSQWDATRRTVTVGPREAASLLVVRENSNPGWQADLGGTALVPITVNGWQQGFVVPAGDAGEVRLRFAPDTPFRVGLLAGAGAALLLLLAAVVPERRRRATGQLSPAGPFGSRVAAGVGAALLVAIGSWWAVAALAVAAAVLVLGRFLAPGRMPWWWVLGAAAAYGAAGILVLAGPYGSANPAADRAPAQVLCLVALAVLVVSVWEPGRARATRGPAPAQPVAGAPTR